MTAKAECQPTVREIAAAARVSKTTVSAALGASGRISPSTRKVVLAAARRLGYRPDAHLSQLMTYLRKGRGAAATCNLGWINSSKEELMWRRAPWFRGYLLGACSRAKALGYALEELWLEPETRGSGLDRQLHARGIRGLIVPWPTPHPAWKRLSWRSYAAVILDESETSLPLDRVVMNRRSDVVLAMERLRAMGYCRPGLWLEARADALSHHDTSAAFLGWCHRNIGDTPCINLPKRSTAAALLTWYEESRPDVIVCCDSRLKDWLEEAGLSVPQTVALVHLNLADDVKGWSGIIQDHQELGRTAVDLVVAALNRHTPGPPLCPREVALAGAWKDGATTRRK